DQACFGCGPRHPTGFRLRFERLGDAVVTHFTPGEDHQGPPNVMHGGLVTTLADEVAAWAVVGLLGRFGFTARIQCAFHRPVRIGVPVEARSWIEKDMRRLADVGVRLSQAEGPCLTGTFRFAMMDQAGAERLMGRPMDAAWQRFSRGRSGPRE
ncbi:MAG TPA: PaaI family thioesterase, partial [Polyangiaceae bacterium LLY-WYZ-14_1]|nr:PaaI family thioesterase [Polyangiaceae bacterium LLY-WYZ-14_1]